MNTVERICNECTTLLNLLEIHFGVEPSDEILQDLLRNFGQNTRSRVLEPLRELYGKLGDENILIVEASMAKNVEMMNFLITPFGSVPLELACVMHFLDGKVGIKV